MIRRLKELLTHEMITYTEYIFSTNIGLSDIKVEPFTVCDKNSKQAIHKVLFMFKDSR